ncbi:CoA-binding protein [Rhodohalobacter sp. 614A]|uniref:CoA-binding protein n=1 Tax=Rhodohalobacter sp. 614A TaxID=2908649 RepID=UPI001F1CD7F2|nr:CoA-binding protein [Rhodohalobacter sp. 614A]
MADIKKAAESFLGLHTIAVVGVSSKGDTAANIIYKKLREQGYKVFAVNPNAKKAEGDACYPSLQSIPDQVDGVVIGTAPDVTPIIVSECASLGIKNIWIHRSFGVGSFHPEALKIAAENNLSLIPGGCPMMFSEPVDPGHKCMRWFLKVTGKQARPVGFHP